MGKGVLAELRDAKSTGTMFRQMMDAIDKLCNAVDRNTDAIERLIKEMKK